MKHMGKRSKSIFACILSLTMIIQCPVLSVTPVGADVSQPSAVSKEWVTPSTENTTAQAEPAESQEDEPETKDEPSEDPEDPAIPPADPSEDNGDTKTADQKDQDTEDTADVDDTASKENAKQDAESKESAAGEQIYIKEVNFTVASDGTAPFDDDNNDGDDNDSQNGRVRTYDEIKYNISTTYQAPNNEPVAGKNIFYAVTVPNDDNLVLDLKASGLSEQQVQQSTNSSDYTKTYAFSFPIPASSTDGSGNVGHDIIFDIRGMHNNDTITPSVKCWLEGNDENIDPATNTPVVNAASAPTVTVTAAPAYNIILKHGSSSDLQFYNFNSDNSKNTFDNTKYQASDYTNETVKGYGVTWGVAVELRKLDRSKGIRGVEYPDPDKPLTFDVDISDATYNSQNIADEWSPLLYNVRENKGTHSDHIIVQGIPGSNQAGASDPSRFCYNSGTYQVEQTGSKLHFTITGYQIDPSRFPTRSFGSNETYYTDPSNIQEGVFTSAQFTVVYPIVNQSNEDIQSIKGQGGNFVFKAEADHLHATSETGISVNNETIPLGISDQTLADNTAQTAFNITSGHGRTQEIFFPIRTIGQTDQMMANLIP